MDDGGDELKALALGVRRARSGDHAPSTVGRPKGWWKRGFDA